ncbi:hypothetical protein FEI14_07435 [Lacticaseibacillus zeae]|uniref:Uncharacterized protein n=1 Tax=Lacticaseibacillus zeae TaxID=57037 RepID=A0A5R8LXQ6_LACZE|nr:hypothetical protein FEI14_07435 [Lacticaseibacillus zeae]
MELLLVGRSLPRLQQGRALKPRFLRVQSRAHSVPSPAGRRLWSLARPGTYCPSFFELFGIH